MELTKEELEENLAEVQEKVAAAAKRAGRDPKDIQLLPVSKTKPVEDMRVLMEKGVTAFGENYVQEIRQKYEELGDAVTWHMIGHLQRNKVKYIIDKVAMIHAVDTIELAEQIEKEAVKHSCEMDVLMEVNIAKEESKWGFSAEEAQEAAARIGQFPHVHLKGLMTSAPITEDPETNRKYFEGLRKLSEKIGSQHYDNVTMDVLSMGMTQDYEVAIEEGATIVRVGTAIFGKRDYHQ